MRKYYFLIFLILIFSVVDHGSIQGQTANMKQSVNYTYDDLFKKMTDLSLLAILPEKGEISGCRSSTDPASKYDPVNDVYINWDANGDNLGRLYDEGDDWVVFDQDGPGVIWRIWAGSCGAGHIKIFIDNNPTPAVDAPFKDFMTRFASFIPNSPNLAPVLSRGSNRISPIPYNSHCKIVLCKDWGSYYQITFVTYPDNIRLPAYNDKIDNAMYFGMMGVERVFQNRGEYPYSDEEKKKKIKFSSSVKAGDTMKIFENENAGAITMIKWNLSDIPKSKRSETMRSLRLKIYWDDRKQPSVDTPLGDFFGSAPGYNPYRSYPMGMIADTCYSYFYMPYRQVNISVENKSNSKITPKITILNEDITEEQAANTMRFCAKWHDEGDWNSLDRSRFAEGGDRFPDWPLIDIKGMGRFCGFALHVDNTWDPDDFPDVNWPDGQQILNFPIIDNFHWWGEGDEKFFVDGEKFPSTFGTGSEDYIGYSLAAIPPFVVFDSAYACQSLVPMKDNNGLTSIVRFQIADNIPFEKSFAGFIEKYRDDVWTFENIKGRCRFACTVYWYQKL